MFHGKLTHVDLAPGFDERGHGVSDMALLSFIRRWHFSFIYLGAMRGA